jgi:hypothetical protein
MSFMSVLHNWSLPGTCQRTAQSDLEAIQKRALEEGLPYQILIASLLHKYASGRLREA